MSLRVLGYAVLVTIFERLCVFVLSAFAGPYDQPRKSPERSVSSDEYRCSQTFIIAIYVLIRDLLVHRGSSEREFPFSSAASRLTDLVLTGPHSASHMFPSRQFSNIHFLYSYPDHPSRHLEVSALPLPQTHPRLPFPFPPSLPPKPPHTAHLKSHPRNLSP